MSEPHEPHQLQLQHGLAGCPLEAPLKEAQRLRAGPAPLPRSRRASTTTRRAPCPARVESTVDNVTAALQPSLARLRAWDKRAEIVAPAPALVLFPRREQARLNAVRPSRARCGVCECRRVDVKRARGRSRPPRAKPWLPSWPAGFRSRLCFSCSLYLPLGLFFCSRHVFSCCGPVHRSCCCRSSCRRAARAVSMGRRQHHDARRHRELPRLPAVRHPPLHVCVPSFLLGPFLLEPDEPLTRSSPAAATYFVRFGSSDRLAFKLLVGFLTIACLGDTVNECAWAWLVTVKAFSDPTIVALLPETYTIYAIFTGVTVLVAQVFFTCVPSSSSSGRRTTADAAPHARSWRLWVISERRNWWLPLGMLLLELTAAGLAMYLAWWTDKTTYLASFTEIEVRPFSSSFPDFPPFSSFNADALTRIPCRQSCGRGSRQGSSSTCSSRARSPSFGNLSIEPRTDPSSSLLAAAASPSTSSSALSVSAAASSSPSAPRRSAASSSRASRRTASRSRCRPSPSCVPPSPPAPLLD